jgi:hypothetical protein
MPETLDWRIVTASPMDGFLLATAEALKALVDRFNIGWFLEMSLDNISNDCFNKLYSNNSLNIGY